MLADWAKLSCLNRSLSRMTSRLNTTGRLETCYSMCIDPARVIQQCQVCRPTLYCIKATNGDYCTWLTASKHSVRLTVCKDHHASWRLESVCLRQTCASRAQTFNLRLTMSNKSRHAALGQQSYNYSCLLAKLGDAIVYTQFYRVHPLDDSDMTHFETGPCMHTDDRTSHAE